MQILNTAACNILEVTSYKGHFILPVKTLAGLQQN